jgi:uncharacterized protein YlaI
LQLGRPTQAITEKQAREKMAPILKLSPKEIATGVENLALADTYFAVNGKSEKTHEFLKNNRNLPISTYIDSDGFSRIPQTTQLRMVLIHYTFHHKFDTFIKTVNKNMFFFFN